MMKASASFVRPTAVSHGTHEAFGDRRQILAKEPQMIAAEALPWASNSLYWKHREFDRSNASSASAYVLARIRGDILSAHFRPGTKLYLKVLTARYQTSVAPIREALSVLCGAGLVIAESQRGFRVAPASPVDFQDIADLRIRLEATALEKSIELGDDVWVEEIYNAYERFMRLAQKVGEHDPITDAWEAYHREFHFCLISHCGSPTLLNFCSQLHDRFDRYRRLALPYGSYMAGIAGDHEEIRDATIRRDTERATALLQEHIQAITGVVLEQFAMTAPQGKARLATGRPTLADRASH
jgi:GntR family transcriptional regulator, carbon starvation induced regulator